MNKNKLGTTDIDVTEICLGTMTWGKQNTEAEAHEQLDYAIDERGINFIDTAELYAVPPEPETYTLTETYIGNWLAKRSNKDRAELVIATKVAGKGPAHIRGGEGITPEGIRTAIAGSLERLQTDYIDLYQLHWPQRDVPKFGARYYTEEMDAANTQAEEEILGILETLKELVDKGQVRHVGLSNETPWGTMKFLELAAKHGLPRMQTIQNAYSLARREFEYGLAEVSLREGVSLLAYSPLAGGMLTGKYQAGKRPEGARFSTWGKDRMAQYASSRMEQFVDKFVEIAEEAGTTPTKLALQFVTQRGFVASNIIGATNMEQLEECIDSAELEISADTWEALNQLSSEIPEPGLN